MEKLLRNALIDWLRADPMLSALNGIEEESPLAVSPPWLGITESSAADWSTKDRPGREILIEFELTTRGDDPAFDHQTAQAIEQRIETLPRDHGAISIITSNFISTRSERQARNLRKTLIEYRFRLLANITE